MVMVMAMGRLGIVDLYCESGCAVEEKVSRKVFNVNTLRVLLGVCVCGK